MKLSTHYTLQTTLIALFLLLTTITVVTIRMRQEAIVDAKQVGKLILAQQAATIKFYTDNLRPELLTLFREHGIDNPPFNPTWMSSGYGNRIIYSYFKEFGYNKYYYKNAAIDARSAANEADPYETAFLEQVQRNPEYKEVAEIVQINNEPYFVYLQRNDPPFGESCMRCHSTPKNAPEGLIRLYGSERSFNKRLGEFPSALSLRIPLKEAYDEVKTITIELSLLILLVTALFFVLHWFIIRHKIGVPIKLLRDKVTAISNNDSLLGEIIELEGFSELEETAQAFSALSLQLAIGKQTLEQQVEERTRELAEANLRLRDEMEHSSRLEQKYTTLFNTMHDGMAIHEMIYDEQGSPVDYRFLAVNPAFEELTALKAGDIRNKGVMEVLPKTDKLWVDNYGKVVATGEPLRFENYSQELNKYFAVVVYRNEPGQFAALCQDVTERKILETTKRQTSKMEAIGTMAGGIAHDFNNILTIILGNIEMAQDYIPEKSPAKGHINHIATASRRAKNIVRQILTFTRHGDQELLAFKPCSVIRESIKLLRSITPASVSIVQDICVNTGVIMADPTQLHQLIMNLFSNAIHAMNQQGTLTVSEQIVRLDKNDFRSTEDLPPGEYVRLSVSDTGVGMDEDTLEKIFDPFFTTKGVDEGTGMGLSTVLGIVQSHGGIIRVESAPGKGSTFHIFFPVVDAEEFVPEEDAAEAPLHGNEHILFIDDEEMLANVGSIMLETFGYTVTMEVNPLEALAAFKSCPEQYDLVITDQTMPVMNGSELATELLKIRPDIPIILCTGFSRQISQEIARGLGIREFCYKPFEREQLARTVRKALEASRGVSW